jgi:glyoxylase-like metal-dependent hydrolase (beta-lactamase superfamily II)
MALGVRMILPSGIVRLTAPNAGPFTQNGTNTYLIGTRTLAVIDPGPDDASHAEAIVAAAGGRPITHILLTHAHRDHVDGLAWLQSLTGAVTLGAGRGPRPAVGVGDPTTSPSGGDFADWDFKPDILLRHGEMFAAGDVPLTAIHTPGHAPDHLCFALDGQPILFSGDHVMGWSTSVIAPPEGHMGDYLASLEHLLTRSEALYLPGHGDAVHDGPRLARAYLLHRQMREKAVLDALRQGAVTAAAIADIVYAGLAPNLANAARLSVEAHLELLRTKRLVRADGDAYALV